MHARRSLYALVTLITILFLASMAVRPIAALARPLPDAPACSLFPPASPWNQRVDTLPVAAGSAALVRASGIEHLHPDFSDSDADGYGIPFNVVGADTPRSTVTFDYDDESDHGGYPIPTAPSIESGSDQHLLMLDRDACVLHELFAAERDGSGWHAGSGARWNLTSLALRPYGWTSADAAGLPILPGLARADELTAGGIDHALRITLPVTQRAYLWPARHYASSNRAPAHAPMGLRLRVKAGYNIAAFSPQTRAILTAGKRYGFIVADNGSAGYVSGAPDAAWDDDDLHHLHDVPASALEVVDTSKLPGTPAARRLWNPRCVVARTTVRCTGFLTRAGYVTARVTRNGRTMSVRRAFAHQGYVRVDLRWYSGARATFRVS